MVVVQESVRIQTETFPSSNEWIPSRKNYRFCIKVVSGSGTLDEQINYYDDNYEFRVVRYALFKRTRKRNQNCMKIF